MSDLVEDPHAFAAANIEAEREYLRSLTPERAARILEHLLELGAELRRSATGRRPDPPLPACWPALLIGREEEEHQESEASEDEPDAPDS